MCGREEDGAGVLPDIDAVEAAGLDGTGRDGDPRFPYTHDDLAIGDWFCIWCGLPRQLDPGLSGCSGETILEHSYADPASRPFAKWGRDRARKRMQRAIVKAASSRTVVLHARVCPARAYGMDHLYQEKFVKRRNLAAHLLRELLYRLDEEEVPTDMLLTALDETINAAVVALSD